ncbi:MAG TPA: hypothetical protein VF832_17305 [Longimicrobiales bacterium]
MPVQPNRRSFLGIMASATGALLGPTSLLSAAQAYPAPAPTKWDLAWLYALKGKHRQVFSVGQLAGHYPLHVVNNWLNAHEEVFGLKPPQVSAVVGISVSYPVNAVDALWEKYELGRRWELKDPQTGEWARRNIYLDMPLPNGRTGVRPLQARGAVFWQCNNALNAVVRELAGDTKQKLEDVRAELLAGLNPGVHLVPAHTMVLGLAQERGFAYEQIG